MRVNEPVDPRVRLAIAQWPEDAPRGAVTTFCAEHEISRKTFYVIRARALADGQAAALEPRSRRPRTSPARLTDEVKQQAVAVRAALESSGLDHGPISVHDKMRTLGLEPASATRTPKRHQSPETSNVTDVLIQFCHRCPETPQESRRPGRRIEATKPG